MTEPTPAAIRIDLSAIFISLELSKKTWLVTSISPGSSKMSRYSVPGGDMPALLNCLQELRRKAEAREGKSFPVIAIQEAGYDGFWIHRALEAEDWITSYVVDAASIAVPRKSRTVKTDRIDGQTLVRTLMARERGEPRVCSMVRVPTVEEEDIRRIGRERTVLKREMTRHTNRIKGLLFSVGVRGYKPLRRDRREALETLRTGDGRLLLVTLKSQISRELDRLELLCAQIEAVCAERDALCAAVADDKISPRAALVALRGIGPEFANVLVSEGLFREFGNRREVAAYAGLAPSPWRSGTINREQGVSKSGNARLRYTMVELAWQWVRWQPETALTRWFVERVNHSGTRNRKVAIVALARKLLVALWKYVTAGVVIEGAIMTAA